MNRFTRAKTILDDAVNGEEIGAHRAFWRGTTRDEFVAKSVFGFPLIVLGDGNGSNLVKALRGEAPFGSDLPNPPAGAIFSRMPASMPPVDPTDIELIRQWIDDDCPDEEEAPSEFFDVDSDGAVEPILHNALWLELDNWAMFQSTPEVNEAIGRFFPVSALWRQFASDTTQEPAWQSAIEQESVRQAIEQLGERQFISFSTHFQLPIPLKVLMDALERFGDNSLPDDAQRPQDRRHNMNGAGMWFVWSSFCDACLRLDVRKDFFLGLSRGVLIGLLNDGLFRGRFHVSGFTPDLVGKQSMRESVLSLTDDQIQPELAKRLVDSGIG